MYYMYMFLNHIKYYYHILLYRYYSIAENTTLRWFEVFYWLNVWCSQ